MAGNADFRTLLTELRALHKAAEAERRAGMGRDEALKAEGNDLFKAARFEDAVAKYTQALNACSDHSSKLAITILNNRCVCVLLRYTRSHLAHPPATALLATSSCPTTTT